MVLFEAKEISKCVFYMRLLIYQVAGYVRYNECGSPKGQVQSTQGFFAVVRMPLTFCCVRYVAHNDRQLSKVTIRQLT